MIQTLSVVVQLFICFFLIVLLYCNINNICEYLFASKTKYFGEFSWHFDSILHVKYAYVHSYPLSLKYSTNT